MASPFVYTALGDSLTFGTGAEEQRGFVHRIYKRMTKHRGDVTLHHCGTVGATTSELYEKVRGDDTLREHISNADLITLSAGGNDLIQAAQKMYMEGLANSMKPAMRKFSNAYDQLLDEVFHLSRTNNRGHVQIVLLENYNPLPMFNDAVLWVRFLNRCIARAAARYGRFVRVAPVYPAFLMREERLISEDGIHPNNDGHDVLAECVERALSLFAVTGGDR
ncbi:GDSL-type esterase/lipase family protein [Paenibacillus alkalitolerans]|uniref:GDSL-type esterase/lipase family protein n=1 Tax=Paenibacillus alkalitolerans TaxID=2799335 RepID=UPI0018F2EE1B|nr:GDSL-type esterase/lipase family protein [Paenibacillus alkalitolerans]